MPTSPETGRNAAKILRRRYQPLDQRKARTYSIRERPTRVRGSDLGGALDGDLRLSDWASRLPAILKARELQQLVSSIVRAREMDRPVIAGIGGHVIKCGLGPLLIQAMREGWLTAVAMNGGASIHDFELALVGQTSEDVAAALPEGMFGMVRETGDAMALAIAAAGPSAGLGEALGRYLRQSAAPHASLSVLAAAAEIGAPATVHVSLGADTVHSHPAIDGTALAAGSLRDFNLLAGVVAHLGDGGVYLNIGSAVMLPEVFVKSLNLARNVTGGQITHFTTANLDMIQGYRPAVNVLQRPHHKDGQGISLTGHHEIMVPLLFHLVHARLGASSADERRLDTEMTV